MRSLAVLLAVVLPALLLGTYRSWLDVPPTLSVVASSMNKRVRAADPEVVVLGSSVALRDVDRAVLAETLGIPERRVLKLTVPAGVAAHWYAVLRHRVLDRGARPRLILVADTLAALLTPRVEGHDTMLRLVGQLPEGDPVVSSLVFGEGGLAREHQRAQQTALRRALVGRLADVWMGAGTAEAGRQQVQEATDVVFATEHLDPSRHGGVPEMFRQPEPERSWFVPRSLDETFLPHLIAAADEAGSELLFARLPLSPAFPEADRMPAHVERLAFEALADAGHHAVELRSLGLDDGEFEDRDHMGTAAMVRVTRILGELGARALSGEDTTFRPPPVSLTVDGAAVEGVAAGDGVSLRAGETLEVSGAGWQDAARLAVCASSPVSVVFDERALGMAAVVREDVATGAQWALRIRADADGVVEGVTLGTPMQRLVAVGDDVACQPQTLRLVGGRRTDLGVSPVFETPAPRFDVPVRFTGAGGGVQRIQLPKWTGVADAPSDPSSMNRLQGGGVAGNDFMADACSPLRLYEDGVVLPRHNTFCAHVRRFGEGRSCHVGPALWFAPLHGTATPARYQLGLDPDRHCALKARKGNTAVYDGVWVYPGDVVRFEAPRPMARGARYVSLRATAMRGPGTSLVVDGLGDAGPALAEGGTAVFALAEPDVAPVVRLSAPDDTYWLLTHLVVSEEAPREP